jgi:hypothetical protein
LFNTGRGLVVVGNLRSSPQVGVRSNTLVVRRRT